MKWLCAAPPALLLWAATSAAAAGSLAVERTLELHEVAMFRAVESRRGDALSVHLAGIAMHSALVVDRVETVREGDALRVRVTLVPTRAGRSGSFEATIDLPAGVRRVTFGDEGREVWTAPAPSCPEAPKGGPGDVVRALYAAFPWEGQRPVMAAPRQELVKFFDDSLTRLLVRDLECRRRTGEYCWLTVDPIYVAQDVRINDMRFCASDRGANWVEVRFVNLGHPSVVTFEVVKTVAGWRIADVAGGSGSTLVENLSKPLP